MPEIQAFRAVRYNLGHVGRLSDVIAPPYDVIAPAMQDELYKRHPCNVIRLILNRHEPGDDDELNNRYTRAARFLKNWQSEGVLQTEADPAVYVYHQIFTEQGTTYTRRGFMARLRLSRFGEGQVFPHEETMAAPKIDRLMLMTTCKANLSPIFSLYPDADNQAQNLLEDAIRGQTPLEAVDHLGVVHRIWPVTDVSTIAAVQSVMGPKPVFIADGHHRYETACEYRDHVYQSGFLSADHPANFVLMMCVAMEDPGMIVLPTHRLFSGVPEISADELIAALGDCFTCRAAGEGPELAPEIWEDVETANDQTTLGLFTHKDGRWTVVTLTDAGRRRMDEVAKDHSEEWRGVGVAILQRLIVADRLGCTELPDPKYERSLDVVIEGCRSGEYPLAAVVMPATLAHVRTISLRGERMPPKSTYFYPKLLSGLVVNPIE